MKILIKGGRVIDPADNLDKIVDILIENRKIKALDTDIAINENVEIIDGRGKVICPGFIDLHVHLRDPGLTYKETLATGTLAAAGGGFTSIACMPNTIPVLDNPELIGNFMNRVQKEAYVNVYPIGAITLESEGRALTDFYSLKEAGVVALSDDGRVVQNAELMYRALLRSKDLGLPISQHAEDMYLSSGTVINDGDIAFRMGVKGDPDVSESIIVARDILLAARTGGHIHIGHISTAEAARLVRQAKEQGIRVTAEVTPHHLILTEEDVLKVGSNGKMRPPLRTKKDVEALREALRDGTIDCIATDHAPHSLEEKEVNLTNAANGIVGLETGVGLVLTHLVDKDIITLNEAIRAWTIRPAEIFGLKNKGRLAIGYDADITILDLEKEWVVDSNQFYSKGKNTPFNGWQLKGKAVLTMVGGKIVWMGEDWKKGGISDGILN